MRAPTLKKINIATLYLSISLVFAPLHLRASAAEPLEVSQGEVVELKISGVGLTALEGHLGKNRILFYPADGKNYAALVGIDLEAMPAIVNIVVKGTSKGGRRRDIQIPIKIKTKSFQHESFAVAPEFDDLGPDVLERIRQEQQQLDQVFATFTPERLWERPFISPVAAAITSPFGYRRVINGMPRAPHTGVDLRAPLGTEVLAANHGRVALIGDFFFSGKSLVLDHGGGLYTMYFHLSEFKVEEGADVHKGDIIGLSGMTGRVTGPHLHWGARIGGARVDPFELIEKLRGKGESVAGSDLKIKRKEE
ncbi:MAG TPA: M23 family metallopeptidase [Methylomirabilota bacterium]|nr:M23 family metallopeptidase [Methylomirabilota bacterium]